MTWHPVPNPELPIAASVQVPQATRFDGGEGVWWDAGYVYFTTKGNEVVWVHDLAADTIKVLYDPAETSDPQLFGVDNVVVSRSGDLFVCEDSDNMEIHVIAADTSQVAPFLRILGQEGSEATGPAFDPSGTRLYFSSQRANVNGITYEVSGPFRTRDARQPREGEVAPTVVELLGRVFT